MTNNTLGRLRAEYLEMPGLRLTVEQAQRLCGVERTLCKSVLDALVEEKFLCVKVNGAYGRATEALHSLAPISRSRSDSRGRISGNSAMGWLGLAAAFVVMIITLAALL